MQANHKNANPNIHKKYSFLQAINDFEDVGLISNK
jgi:hypothetical protein